MPTATTTAGRTSPKTAPRTRSLLPPHHQRKGDALWSPSPRASSMPTPPRKRAVRLRPQGHAPLHHQRSALRTSTPSTCPRRRRHPLPPTSPQRGGPRRLRRPRHLQPAQRQNRCRPPLTPQHASAPRARPPPTPPNRRTRLLAANAPSSHNTDPRSRQCEARALIRRQPRPVPRQLILPTAHTPAHPPPPTQRLKPHPAKDRLRQFPPASAFPHRHCSTPILAAIAKIVVVPL